MKRDTALNAKLKIFRRSLILLLGVTVLGTSGYMTTESWPVWDAFFFTIVTITTVGYGDYGLSETGEKFTAVLMLVGIGSLTYTLSQIMQAAVAFGFDRERNMNRQISNLRDHVIVCGLGRIGIQVCELMDEAGMGFVAIDLDASTVETARKRGWIALEGDATDDNLLYSAGLSKARALVCVASRDSDNIVVTLSAHTLCPELEIFSRAENADSIRKIRRAGATHVVSPVLVGGQKITDAILRPGLSMLLDPIDERGKAVRLFEIRIDSESPLAGRTIKEIGADHREIVFVAMTESEGVDGEVSVRPDASLKLRTGQTYVVAGSESSIGPFLEQVGRRAA